jgi:hypothetical protein
MNLSRELMCPIEFRIRVVAAISGWNTFKSVQILLLELRDAEGEHEMFCLWPENHMLKTKMLNAFD